ncbi:hypothetical protein FRC19_011571 [Serendipita sp. 401]|nr:hypothetical protein FRC19_011571 [Serendipita sp. 401]KAG9058220.1 hypothetical protein FS842_000161 [Serendipita sp. 407]
MSLLVQRVIWESDPGPPFTSNPAQRSIEILHDDILLYIFQIYLQARHSIMNLLLICARWHNIVKSQPSLWCEIRYALEATIIHRKRERVASKSGYDWILPYDLGLTCTTPKQLARSIERLNGASFSITFLEPVTLENQADHSWDCVPWGEFSERCTEIHIFNQNVSLPILENLPVMRNLRRASSIEYTERNIPRILHKISKEIPSPLLDLSIGAPGDLDTNLFPSIAARIKVFDAGFVPFLLTLDDCRRLLSSFRDLEHLTWRWHRFDPDELREAISWNFKLKTLTITNLFPSLFPLSLLAGLVELAIDVQQKPSIESYKAFLIDKGVENHSLVALHSLTHLTLVGHWIDLLRIHAPSLHKLVLQAGSIRPDSDAIRYLIHTRMRPSIVHIVDLGRGSMLNGLLRQPFVDIVELKMHIPVQWVRSGHLVQFLSVSKSGKKRGELMIAPNLRHLVVAVYSSLVTEKEAIKKAVEEAARARMESGPLLSVRCLGEEVNFTLRSK